MNMKPMNRCSRVLRSLQISNLSTTDRCGVWTCVPAALGVLVLLIVIFGIPAIV